MFYSILDAVKVEEGCLCLPQQGLFRGWRRVTILALRRLFGHLFVNVPRRHPEPQHGGQRRVVQHDPDLRREQTESAVSFICLTFRNFLLIYTVKCATENSQDFTRGIIVNSGNICSASMSLQGRFRRRFPSRPDCFVLSFTGRQ